MNHDSGLGHGLNRGTGSSSLMIKEPKWKVQEYRGCLDTKSPHVSPWFLAVGNIEIDSSNEWHQFRVVIHHD